MSQRQFAEHLGVSDRAVAKWESGGSSYNPRPETQALLDTALERATPEESERFQTSGARTEPGRGTESLRLDSHKFMPAFIGHYQADRLMKRLGTTRPQSVLDVGSAAVDHPAADRCTLYVHPCGVVVFHIVEPKTPQTLADLAVWRYETYRTDPGWAAEVLADLLASNDPVLLRPPYVFSAYWMHTMPWDPSVLESALQLAATPSPLVDRSDPEQIVSLGADAERALLESGFTHPDVAAIGVHGVSAGYVGWSGISYHPLAPERALTVDELVAVEVLVQAMWCYATHLQSAVEDGRDPDVPEQYGWRFLRAAQARLTTARPLETSQHCLMRETIVKTSGLTEILRGAQAALREGR